MMGTWIKVNGFTYKCSACQHDIHTIFDPALWKDAWKECPWCGDKKEVVDGEDGEVPRS